MKRLLIVGISFLLISVPLQGRGKKRLSSKDDCRSATIASDCQWAHDWYFYWPYHYYGSHHPYYWHDGFHLSFGG